MDSEEHIEGFRQHLPHLHVLFCSDNLHLDIDILTEIATDIRIVFICLDLPYFRHRLLVLFGFFGDCIRETSFF